MTALVITAVLEPHGPAAAILLTEDQVAQLGGGRTRPSSSRSAPAAPACASGGWAGRS